MYLLIQDRSIGSFILINNSDHQCNKLGPKIQILDGWSLIFPRNVLFLTLLRSGNMQNKRLKGMTLVRNHCQTGGSDEESCEQLRSCEPRLVHSGFLPSLNGIPRIIIIEVIPLMWLLPRPKFEFCVYNGVCLKFVLPKQFFKSHTGFVGRTQERLSGYQVSTVKFYRYI